MQKDICSVDSCQFDQDLNQFVFPLGTLSKQDLTLNVDEQNTVNRVQFVWLISETIMHAACDCNI